MANIPQEVTPNGTEYFRLFSPLGSPGGSAKGILQNLLAALAALAVAAAAFFHVNVDCVPIDIDFTTAHLEVQLQNLEEGQEVSWFLVRGPGIPEPPIPGEDGLAKLQDLLTQLFLENLEPGTEYTIVFTTPGETGEPDIIHTFTFRTPGLPPAPPPGETGDTGSGDPPPADLPPQEPPEEPPKEPPQEPPKEPDTETEEPPAEEPPLTPPPGGGGGDDFTDGGAGGPSAPVYVSSAGGFMELGPAAPGFAGEYFMVFPFSLNGYTFQSIHVSGTILERTGPYGGTPRTIADDFAPGADELNELDDAVMLWYPVSGAYSESHLKATLTYQDAAGNEHQMESPVQSFYPTYLDSASDANTLTASYDGANVTFYAEIGALHSGDLDFEITTITLNGVSIPFAPTLVSGTFPISFTLPADQVPTGPLTLTVTGNTAINDPEYGLTSYEEMTSSTTATTQVFGTVGPITAPIGKGINGVTCTSVAVVSGDPNRVAVGSTVTMQLNFTGIPEPEEFLLIPSISSATLSNLSVSSVEVHGDSMPAVMTVTFTMPSHNVTDADFTIGDFAAEPLSTGFSLPLPPEEEEETPDSLPPEEEEETPDPLTPEAEENPDPQAPEAEENPDPQAPEEAEEIPDPLDPGEGEEPPAVPDPPAT